jgi:hypothetical protein
MPPDSEPLFEIGFTEAQLRQLKRMLRGVSRPLSDIHFPIDVYLEAIEDTRRLCPECGTPGGGIPCGHYYDAIEILTDDDERDMIDQHRQYERDTGLA